MFKSLLSNADLVLRYMTTSEDVNKPNTEAEGAIVVEAVTRQVAKINTLRKLSAYCSEL